MDPRNDEKYTISGSLGVGKVFTRYCCSDVLVAWLFPCTEIHYTILYSKTTKRIYFGNLRNASITQPHLARWIPQKWTPPVRNQISIWPRSKAYNAFAFAITVYQISSAENINVHSSMDHGLRWCKVSSRGYQISERWFRNREGDGMVYPDVLWCHAVMLCHVPRVS